MYVWVKKLSQHVTSTCLTCSMYNVMRSNFLCPWTFSKFKWWVRWVKKPFSQILLTEPFAVGPYCFQFSVVPGEIACSCVEPFSVQFVDWSLESIWLSFSCSLDSVPVNAQGATGVWLGAIHTRLPQLWCSDLRYLAFLQPFNRCFRIVGYPFAIQIFTVLYCLVRWPVWSRLGGNWTSTELPLDQLGSPDTTCAGCDTTARHRLGRLFFVQCGFCRQLRWILIWCTMWEKGKNEGLTQQFMNTFSSVSVAWSALHTNTRGRWVFLVTTTRSHFHLAQLACHLCAGFRYCKILQTLQDLIDRRAFLMSTAENCFADFRRLSGMHFWILSAMQR